jgi:hypothetical protein
LTNHEKLHDPKVRKLLLSPDRFGGVRMNLKEATPFRVHPTSTCGKDSLFVEIELGDWKVTIVKAKPLFPWRKHSRELGISLRRNDLDLHDFDLFSAPELLLSDPLIPGSKSFLLKKAKQREKGLLLPFSIASRLEGIFKPVKSPIFTFYP